MHMGGAGTAMMKHIMKKKNARFFMAMGEHEKDVRIRGMNYAISQLKKSNLDHKYYQIPQAGHADLSTDKLYEALRYIFGD